MKIFALADLHLSFSCPDKDMAFFGKIWEGYTDKIEKNWKEKISSDDLVLIAGDISWAMKDEVQLDFAWIDRLPGKKVLIKGNHDYWWGSLKKVYEYLPPSISVIQNNTFDYKGISIGGTRLWDTTEYHFNQFIEFQENPKANKEKLIQQDLEEKIFDRELKRLELSLSSLDPKAKVRIAMTHYPPISFDLKDSKASKILEKYNVDVCIFGHLHNIKKDTKLFGSKNGIEYLLTSCDYLDFDPIEIVLK